MVWYDICLYTCYNTIHLSKSLFCKGVEHSMKLYYYNTITKTSLLSHLPIFTLQNFHCTIANLNNLTSLLLLYITTPVDEHTPLQEWGCTWGGGRATFYRPSTGMLVSVQSDDHRGCKVLDHVKDAHFPQSMH